MIDCKLKRYPKYKESGIEWLGEVPEEWEIKKLKYVGKVQFSNVDKHSIENEEPVRLCNYVDVYKNEFIDLKLDFMEATATKQEISKFKLEIGDVLVTKDSETPDDIAVPALVREVAERLVCGYHLAQIKTYNEKLLGDYLFRLFQTRSFNAVFESAARGITRYGLSTDIFTDALIPLPDLSEQKHMFAYLDCKTTQIETLIEKKQKLIELLKEYRTAIINQAVTKGLNPDVPMKDSGIEWLGEVPEHWEVKKLKYLAPNATVGIVITPSKYYVEIGVPCPRSLNVKEGKIEDKDLVFISDESNKLLKKSMIFAGDLICVRSGQPGTTAVVDERFHGANCIDLLIIRQSSMFNSYFMCYLLNSHFAKQQFASGTDGAIQQHFNLETANNLVIPYPPYKEQCRIINFLDNQTSNIDSIITKTENQIAILKEYRTALISDVVTGKIDVRGEV